MPPLGPLSPGNPSPTPRAGSCRTARAGGRVELPGQLTQLVRSPGQGRPGPGPLQDLWEQGHRAVAGARQPAGSSPVCWAQARARARAQSGASCLQPTPITWTGETSPAAASEEGPESAGAFCSPRAGSSPSGFTWVGGAGCGSARPGKQWALAWGWPQLEAGRGGHVRQVGPGFLRAPQVLLQASSWAPTPGLL